MAEFFIETEAQANGEHLVHFSSCGSLPAQDKLFYLGSIASYSSAKTEALRKFYQVNACTACASKYVA